LSFPQEALKIPVVAGREANLDGCEGECVIRYETPEIMEVTILQCEGAMVFDYDYHFEENHIIRFPKYELESGT